MNISIKDLDYFASKTQWLKLYEVEEKEQGQVSYLLPDGCSVVANFNTGDRKVNSIIDKNDEKITFEID
jgi:hypothetical protein